MKRFFSILFASLILISGMHFTIASHICSGELAAVKCSFTGENASCGMTEDQNPVPANGDLKTNCCKNHVSAFSVDNNYFNSSLVLKEITGGITPVVAVAPDFLLVTPDASKTYYSMVGPPVSKSYKSVDQSFICVFII